MTLRLWIDTDVGGDPDDAVALLAAAAHPEVELVGVSTVAGDVRWRADTARRVLATVGADDLLLYAGPPDPRALAVCDAVLAIGPLTNLAALARAGADLPPLVAMGGCLQPVHHRGAVRTVEHNFAADPVAAALVVATASDLLVVPLDVTARMKLDEPALDRLVRAAPVLVDEVARWWDEQADPVADTTDAPVCLHDPLALLALLGEPCVRIEPRSLAVTVEGALVEHASEGAERDVVVDVDPDAARERVLGLLGA